MNASELRHWLANGRNITVLTENKYRSQWQNTLIPTLQKDVSVLNGTAIVLSRSGAGIPVMMKDGKIARVL
jgi:hypothetical protein